MNLFKSIIKSVDFKHYIKYYVIAIITALFLKGILESDNIFGLGYMIFLSFNVVVFPFTMIVWDELINIFLPKTIGIYIPFIILIPFVIIKYVFLFLFSIFIAPVGFLYLGYKVNKDGIEVLEEVYDEWRIWVWIKRGV